MKNTEEKAFGGMLTLVVTIFVLALTVAGFYFLVLKPGQPHAAPLAPTTWALS